MTPAESNTRPTGFRGFKPLQSNYVYCPNQFFDICLPHGSRGVVRLVAYLLRQTLGWLDEEGQPIEQEITVSYRKLIEEAGISRGAIRDAVEESIARSFIDQLREGNRNGRGGRLSPHSIDCDGGVPTSITKILNPSMDSTPGKGIARRSRTPFSTSLFPTSHWRSSRSWGRSCVTRSGIRTSLGVAARRHRCRTHRSNSTPG